MALTVNAREAFQSILATLRDRVLQRRDQRGLPEFLQALLETAIPMVSGAGYRVTWEF